MSSTEQSTKTSSEKQTTKTTSPDTSDNPNQDLEDSAISLVKRCISRGKNEGKKEAKDPRAKKGYQIVDSVTRLDDDKMEALKTDKNRNKVIRAVEDNPGEIRGYESMMKFAFAKISELNSSSNSGQEVTEDKD